MVSLAVYKHVASQVDCCHLSPSCSLIAGFLGSPDTNRSLRFTRSPPDSCFAQPTFATSHTVVVDTYLLVSK